MSILCTTYVPEGIVLVADSRISINMNMVNKEDSSKTLTHIFPMSDSVKRVCLLNKLQAGVASSGISVLDNLTFSDYIRKFEEEDLKEFDSIFDVADKLSTKTKKFGKALTLHVAGYESGEPFFYTITDGECKRLNSNGTEMQYGITWSGETALIQKLMMTEPKFAVDFKVFPLSDAIDFTEFMVDAAINMQRFEMKPKTCGGDIYILALTRDGALWYKNKLLGKTFIPAPLSQKSGIHFSNDNGNTIN